MAQTEIQLKAKRKDYLLMFCLSIAYATFVLFPNLTAQWGLIDDHIIITAMGYNHRLLLKDIPHFIANIPEIGSMGSYPRVQPFYILFTIIQAYLLGNNVFLWYIARIIGFGISIFIFAILSQKILGKRFGLFLIIILASHQCWADIWARIGPAEIYATPLFAVFCLAYWHLWNSKIKRRTVWYSVLTITGILLLGTKENMLFVLPAATFLIFYNWKQKRLTSAQTVMSALLMICGLFIVGAIYLGLRHNGGADFYGTPISLSYRLNMAYSSLTSNQSWRFEYPAYIPFIISLALYMINMFYTTNIPRRALAIKIRPTITKLFYSECVLFLLWFFQLIIYFKNHIPHGKRYDFPGILFTDLAYLLLISIIIKLIKNCYIKQHVKALLNYDWERVVFIIAVIVLIFFRAPDFKAIYHTALKNSITTQQFHNTLSKIIRLSSENPDIPIIFVSHWVWDYEPIHALRQYLSIKGVKNPIALKLTGYSANSVKGNLEIKLVNKLISISLNGDPQTTEAIAPKGTKFLPYYPLSIYNKSKSCFMIGFSGSANLSCINLGRIYD